MVETSAGVEAVPTRSSVAVEVPNGTVFRLLAIQTRARGGATTRPCWSTTRNEMRTSPGA